MHKWKWREVKSTRLNSFSPNPREVGLYLLEERVSRESRGEKGQRERKKEKEIERGERHFCCQEKYRKYYISALLTDKKK